MITRVVVTDDHELVRAGLAQFLSSSPGIEVVAESANGADLLKQLKNDPVDLILLDMNLPDIQGAELISSIKKTYPHILILALSGNDEIDFVIAALKSGASGFISKGCAPSFLLEAIKKVVTTGKYLDPRMAEQVAYASTSDRIGEIESILSPRELEVFRLIVEGKSVTEIAEQLFISDKTVSTHKCNLLGKLGLKGVADLVRYAIEHNMFSIGIVQPKAISGISEQLSPNSGTKIITTRYLQRRPFDRMATQTIGSTEGGNDTSQWSNQMEAQDMLEFMWGNRDLMWDRKLSVGNEVIDSEHRNLICIVNDIAHAIKARDCRVLKQLFELLEHWLCVHFSNEEMIAQAVEFDFSGHKTAQQYALKELQHLRDELLAKSGIWSDGAAEHFCSYLKEWMIDEHILNLDMQMKPVLQAHDYNFLPGREGSA